MRAILDEHGRPVRCDSCGVMFANVPTVWGERGPLCRDCQAINQSLRSGGIFLSRDLYGDRRFEIAEE